MSDALSPESDCPALADAFAAFLASPELSGSFLAWLAAPGQEPRWRAIVATLLDACLAPGWSRPPQPGPLTFILQQEYSMSVGSVSQFRVTAVIPPRPEPNDIGRQVLALSVDGQPRPEVDVPMDANEFSLGVFPDGAVVSGEYAYIDRSRHANRSQASTFSLTIEDNIAPPQPGAFGFRIEQVFDTGTPTPPDTGTTPPDTGTPTPPDTGTTPPDTGTTPPDTGTTPPDTGTPTDTTGAGAGEPVI